jgi:hypothetical protein
LGEEQILCVINLGETCMTWQHTLLENANSIYEEGAELNSEALSLDAFGHTYLKLT